MKSLDPQTIMTKRRLEHLKSWGEELSRSSSFSWTKADRNLYWLILEEIKRIGHDNYLRSKGLNYFNKKVCPPTQH